MGRNFTQGSYYDRADVALPNFAAYFNCYAEKHFKNAKKWMEFQNKRGGKLVLREIPKPERDEWGSGLQGMESALALTKKHNEKMLALRATASNDPHMGDFIEDNFLSSLSASIKEISCHITNLNRVGRKGHGEYHFERATLDDDDGD